MKSILQYGQAINARNRGQANRIDVYQAGIVAMKDGYQVKAFERIVTRNGFVIIRKRKGE